MADLSRALYLSNQSCTMNHVKFSITMYLTHHKPLNQNWRVCVGQYRTEENKQNYPFILALLCVIQQGPQFYIKKHQCSQELFCHLLYFTLFYLQGMWPFSLTLCLMSQHPPHLLLGSIHNRFRWLLQGLSALAALIPWMLFSGSLQGHLLWRLVTWYFPS